MAKSISLNEHFKNGVFFGYKKFVWGKRFYFGKHTDRTTAEHVALDLIQTAERLQDEGKTEWTKEAIDQCFSQIARPKDDGTVATEPEEPASVAAVPAVKPSGLYAGITSYLAHLKARVPHQLSQSHYSRQVTSTEMLKKVQPDVSLNMIGFEELTKVVGHFTARPISGQTKRPISVDTVVTQIKHIRCLFDYLADAGKWEECRRYHRIFRLKASSLLTARERTIRAQGPKTFTMDELVSLYASATDGQRLYMLLGLNCGFTGIDLATLLNDHVIDGGKAIKRERNKTSVMMQFELWQQTREYLASRMGTTPANDDGLALLTADGKPLVRYEAENRIDSVRSLWRKLVYRTDARKLTFKFLRKTGSQLVADVAGKEVGQMFLSHSAKSVAEKHYFTTTDYQKLAKALRKVHQKLTTAGMFSVKRIVRKNGRPRATQAEQLALAA